MTKHFKTGLREAGLAPRRWHEPGIVTVAAHSLGKDVKPGTLASIWKQAGLKEPKR